MKYDIKIKIIFTLFAVALLLVAAIIIFKYTNTTSKKNQSKKIQNQQIINLEEIEKKFNQAFENWGFRKEWVSAIKVDKQKNIVDKIYRIKVPRDVTIDFILLELNSLLDKYPKLKIVAKDLTLKRKTEIRIFENKKLTILAFAKKDYKTIRAKIPVALIIKSDEISADKLSSLPLFIKTILVPIKSDKLNLIRKITEANIDYIPVIDDEISEYKYSLGEDLTKRELNNSVYRILHDFGKNKIYFYDNSSELCSLPHFEYVKLLFKKRTKIYNLDLITNLLKKNSSEVKTAIQLVISGDKPNLFLLELKQFTLNRNFFVSLWKKGVVFYNVGELLKN